MLLVAEVLGEDVKFDEAEIDGTRRVEGQRQGWTTPIFLGGLRKYKKNINK